MIDSYQAVYDAVRSRIGSVSSHSVLESAAREGFDFSVARAILQEQIYAVGNEMVRPSVVFRPTLAPGDDLWCALYGPNLAEGVAGFGATPDEAMRDFDKNWWQLRTPTAVRSEAVP